MKKMKTLRLQTDPVTKILLALVAGGLWWHAFQPWLANQAHADGPTKVDVVSVGGEKLSLVSQAEIQADEPDSYKRQGLPVTNVNTR